METDLLTYRLSHFMNQISDRQIELLIEKDRNEQERLRQSKKSMIGFHNSKSSADHSREYKAVKNAVLLTKKRYELTNEEAEKAKPKKVELGTILGATNKFSSAIKKEGSETKRPIRNAFFKAAKMAVLINTVKDGKKVCTCESLDSKCLVHDV